MITIGEKTCEKAMIADRVAGYEDIDSLLSAPQFLSVKGPKPSDYSKKKLADTMPTQPVKILMRLHKKTHPEAVIYKEATQASPKPKIIQNNADVIKKYVEQFKTDRDKIKIRKRLHSSVWPELNPLTSETHLLVATVEHVYV